MDCFAACSAKTIKSSNRYNITRSYYYEQVSTRLANRHLQGSSCTRRQGALGVPDCVRRWQSCLTRAIPTGQDAPRAPCPTPTGSITTRLSAIVAHLTASGQHSSSLELFYAPHSSCDFRCLADSGNGTVLRGLACAGDSKHGIGSGVLLYGDRALTAARFKERLCSRNASQH